MICPTCFSYMHILDMHSQVYLQILFIYLLYCTHMEPFPYWACSSRCAVRRQRQLQLRPRRSLGHQLPWIVTVGAVLLRIGLLQHPHACSKAIPEGPSESMYHQSFEIMSTIEIQILYISMGSRICWSSHILFTFKPGVWDVGFSMLHQHEKWCTQCAGAHCQELAAAAGVCNADDCEFAVVPVSCTITSTPGYPKQSQHSSVSQQDTGYAGYYCFQTIYFEEQ